MAAPTHILAGALRLGLGARLAPLGPRPSEPLVLYDFEACPFCRKVREAVSMLDLVTDVRPCPKGGTRFRPELAALVREVRLPTLLDPGAAPEGRVLQESETIVRVLFARYGTGLPPVQARLGPVGTWTSGLVTAITRAGGKLARASRPLDPALRYELVASEADEASRRVRAVMSELEIPYRLLPAAEGSARARAHRRLPVLRGEHELVGAPAILAHLERVHSA